MIAEQRREARSGTQSTLRSQFLSSEIQKARRKGTPSSLSLSLSLKKKKKGKDTHTSPKRAGPSQGTFSAFLEIKSHGLSAVSGRVGRLF